MRGRGLRTLHYVLMSSTCPRRTFRADIIASHELRPPARRPPRHASTCCRSCRGSCCRRRCCRSPSPTLTTAACSTAALAAGGYVGVVQAGGDGSPAGFYAVGCLARVHRGGAVGGGRSRCGWKGLSASASARSCRWKGDVPRATVDYGEFAARSRRRREPEPEGWKLEVFKDRIVEFGRRQFGSAGVLETMSPRQVVLFMARPPRSLPPSGRPCSRRGASRT